MTIFTPPSPDAPAPSPSPALTGDPFFPALDPAEFAAAMRVNTAVTPARVAEALLAAMIEVDGDEDLRRLKTQWTAAGYAALAEVPAPLFAGVSRLVFLYRRAVFCLAKADLDENYRDSATTPHGDRRADALEPTVEDHRRNARWALSDLVGRPRTTVELI